MRGAHENENVDHANGTKIMMFVKPEFNFHGNLSNRHYLGTE